MQLSDDQPDPDDELADSVAHLQAAMEQVRQGMNMSLAEALDAIAARHGLSLGEPDK